MRITQVNPGRPDYYDRGAEVQNLSYYGSGIGPHAITTRFTYTVPDGKRAVIDSLLIYAVRTGAATTLGEVRIDIDHEIGVGDILYLGNMRFIDNALNVYRQDSKTQLGFMLPGEKIYCRTRDTSTGGTVDYIVCVKVYEFSA